MKCINLFGAAGSGKSTTAAELFAKLRKAGYRCELLPEAAKGYCYTDATTVLQDQLLITAQQHHYMYFLNKSKFLDFLIIDSPILLGLFYTRKYEYFVNMDKLIIDLYNSYDNINYYIERNHPYDATNRVQTEHEAINDNIELKLLLDYHSVPYKLKRSSKKLAKTIFKDITKNG